MSNQSLLSGKQLPQDLKKMSLPQLNRICRELRQRLLDVVSKNGGHLASNLGIVELTVALHVVFDSPEDRIVWDVGHQSYVHKMLTGRLEKFHTIRSKGGLSGFPKTSESVHDAFTAGHASNGISAAGGIASAFAVCGNPHHAVAVVGDGALTGGLAFEGLNNAGRAGNRLVVVLNDNEMSISKNVGSVARYFAVKRASEGYTQVKEAVERAVVGIPLVGSPMRSAISSTKRAVRRILYNSNLFEDLGFGYLGPINGHDLDALITTLRHAKSLNRPVVVHVNTVKGKGYALAEANPSAYHGVSPFSLETGVSTRKKEDFSACFGNKLLKMAEKDSKICAITAAMTTGTGLEPFAERYGQIGRFFDVGIAEGHAVTFACGLAQAGMKPVFAVYSTFLQRCFDQIVHDGAIEPKHVVLAIDRAGIVGEDGETHQGLFDIPLLSAVPNMVCYSPANYNQLEYALEQAFHHQNGLVSLRYPRGKEYNFTESYTGEYTHIKEGENLLLISYGREMSQIEKVKQIRSQSGEKTDLLCLNRIIPIPEEALKLAMAYPRICFVEESVESGSIGCSFFKQLIRGGYNGRWVHKTIQFPFLPAQTVDEALGVCGLDSDGIIQLLLNFDESKNHD